MTDERVPGKALEEANRRSSTDFQDRTFMGGIGVRARSALFSLLGLALLGAGIAGLFHADRELTRANNAQKQAMELSSLVSGIERDVWRIRAEADDLSKLLKANTQPVTDAEKAATQEHLALADTIGKRLDKIYLRPDAAAISEHVSTLREAIAQYIEKYDPAARQAAQQTPDVSKPEISLRQAMLGMSKIVEGANILSLNQSMGAIREATTNFVESGSGTDLKLIEEHQKELLRVLSAVPIADDDIKAIEKVSGTFKTALEEYATVRLIRDNTVERLHELLSYMVPSLDALVHFTGNNFNQSVNSREVLRQRFRIYIAAGAVGSVLVLLIFGLAFMRSVSAPVVAAAKAARDLQKGHTDYTLWGLGNDDETGEIARAFAYIRNQLGETHKLREAMKKAKAEAERGRAASEEAEWLRRDLESMKAEADRGKEAREEVALLRKIIDATADNVSRKQADDQAATSPVLPVPAPLPATAELTLDTISSISRRVARSSESVTAAADEAERTGTLIRNLSDASEKIGAIENLIADIGEQADMLIVSTPEQGPDTNLVILNGEGDKDGQRDNGITRRFDIIRSAAGQATWAIRDIGSLIKDSREVALAIARLSSAEALEVTTDLLQQSENLRGMLDTLVQRMQDQITEPGPGKSTPGSNRGDGGPSSA